ncbi:murein hydrolase transporter LrgA [Skermanella stibiiresistens SB22]|uniref:Murein hydrolase transporter LrgA n=1 Tax=Skermanella stibiiresistens SB22 TaxID=1385369 RepID=W9H578_9PROT|nr:CidA/LrgA family protein [Skermanella stibiiresistens]EWY39941.1 murein hydrolase transporter LrgA [Skermanella stibiiresistens SB22]
MIAALMGLLACQLAGELIARLLSLPIPGPVLGTILLFLALLARGKVPETMRDVARTLLANLSLLFVPAGVGIIQHLDRLRGEWLGILAAVFGSTVLTMIVAVLVFRGVSRLTGADRISPDRGRA